MGRQIGAIFRQIHTLPARSGNTHTHARTHPSMHTRTHAHTQTHAQHTQTHTHARSHTHTHTHTHTDSWTAHLAVYSGVFLYSIWCIVLWWLYHYSINLHFYIFILQLQWGWFWSLFCLYGLCFKLVSCFIMSMHEGHQVMWWTAFFVSTLCCHSTRSFFFVFCYKTKIIWKIDLPQGNFLTITL